MEYVCKNKECPEYGKHDYYAKESYVFQKGAMIGKNAHCPHCGEIREKIDPNEDIPLSQKNVNMNFFNGMSMERKKEILKKRAHDDYLKHTVEKKEAMLNQAKREMAEIRRR